MPWFFSLCVSFSRSLLAHSIVSVLHLGIDNRFVAFIQRRTQHIKTSFWKMVSDLSVELQSYVPGISFYSL